MPVTVIEKRRKVFLFKPQQFAIIRITISFVLAHQRSFVLGKKSWMNQHAKA